MALQVDWRKALPPRAGWLRLLACPTSFVFVAGLLLTLQGKARILRHIDDVSFWPLVLPWAIGIDVFIYMGLAAMFAVGEGRSPWMRAATYPLTALIASLALINAWYLSVTGEQLTWQAIGLGFDRVSDLWLVMSEAMWAAKVRTLLFAVVLIGIPSAIRWGLRKRTGPWRRGEHDLERAHCAAFVAVVGLVLAIVWPSPDALGAQRIGGNAAVATYWQWLTDDGDDVIHGDLFEAYREPQLVTAEEIARFKAMPGRPNIVVFILESTRFDHTSLAGARARGTKTPNLARLAAAGTSALSARSVLPHTTKSVFSMMCGRYPAMQLGVIEYSHSLEIQCAPDVLTKGGYKTAFFQSAWGTFEERVRLVDKLGYDHFEGWEDIQGEMVGYLASDDMSMVDPALRWLDARQFDSIDPDAPFFLTMLTSAAHHPYRLPSNLPANGASSDEERFARIVEREDELIGRMLAALEQRGLRDNTIVVVLGDHGEGFGAKGVRQHDNNYYEEGLHVPFVIQGPGVPVREISQNVTVADLGPTLLGLAGARVREEAAQQLIGVDLLAGEVPERTLMFSCYYELRCRGFVSGTDKVVVVPNTGRGYYFDLVSDPDETNPRPVPAALREFIPTMTRILDEYQTRSFPLTLGETRPYGDWVCANNQKCTHPNARAFKLKD